MASHQIRTHLGLVTSDPNGQLLARQLSLSHFNVRLFEVDSKPNEDGTQSHNLVQCCSIAEAVEGSGILIFMVPDLIKLEAILTDTLSVIADETAVIFCGGFSPTYITSLVKNISEKQDNLLLINAVISFDSDSVVKVLASGTSKALVETGTVLAAICKDFVQIEGDVTAASKVWMVEKLLVAVHITAAAEAMVLGATAGINTWDLYEIITNAAGSSRMFVDRVPHMLVDDYEKSDSTVQKFADGLTLLLEEARTLLFPLPLTAIANQYFHMAYSSGYGNFSDAAIVKIWEKASNVKIIGAAKNDQDTFAQKVENITKEAPSVQNVGFIGLGAMGFGMASTLLQEKFTVCGFDVYEPTLERFRKLGGLTGNSVAEAVRVSEVVVVMVATEAQAERVLFGEKGAVSAVPNGCTIVLCSTVSPVYVAKLEQRLRAEGRDLHLVDAPVSGGVVKAANGSLTIMAAGSEEALKRAGLVLSTLSETLYIIDGGAGKGSGVKVVNQLLAGVHIAVSAEAMAFGARLGLDTKTLYQIIQNSESSSWMFINRVPHMLNADYTPLSAVNIFIKDLGIVLSQGKSCGTFIHLSAAAHQQFLLAAAAGFAYEDDSAVVKIYEKLAGISVAALDAKPSSKADPVPKASKVSKTEVASKDHLLGSLIPEWPQDSTKEITELEDSGKAKVLVVLDDDPTGTQTVHGVTVLTEWDVDSIREEFQKQPVCFFILTNSRALSSEKAFSLIQTIVTNVKAAAADTGSSYTIVLRGDSTLRGHFPEEPDAVKSVLGDTDVWIICPFFPQGGRFTINDIHYVADEDKLIPAGETEFAKDAVFGYQSSNLRDWVEEKTKGRIKASDVGSVSIDMLRKGGPLAVCEYLSSLPKGSICIVNSASEKDISVFSSGMIQAELQGKSFLCRTAATFVSARIGIKHKPPITPKDFGISKSNTGGLIVVGSYVPKSTKQVEELKARCSHFIHSLTVHVPVFASGSPAACEEEIKQIVTAADALLAAGKDTVIVTSRDLVTGKDNLENLAINSRVSLALVEIVKRIKVQPRYLLAKGGITSSDLATKAMGARRAEVFGQALPGIPIWKLGAGSRHPGIPYIVFPGNVGSTTALAEIVTTWACTPRQSVKTMLLEADKGGYAVGAFNVYNLEGVKAVVAAAEAERSPAILQIHPGAWKHGKEPLLACCIAAAKSAKVPIAVHLDHGDDEQAIISALDMGFDSVMVDCSSLPFEENVKGTKRITEIAHAKDILVEAELGRLTGKEDDTNVEEYEEKLTDPDQAEIFLKETQVDTLAVCVGNVHGKYPPTGPKIQLDLLKKLKSVASKHNTLLVLHGASGVPEELVKECIEIGVRKFNVNTEVRAAYVDAIKNGSGDLVDVMRSAEAAMQAIVAQKLALFGSSGRAPPQ